MKRSEIIELLDSLGLKKNIIEHILAVEKFALQIASLILKNNPEFKIDLKLISDGSLLHDIGRSVTHSISHAVEGVKIAKKYNFNQQTLSIIENHIGAGITKEEAKTLNLPVKDYLPISLEEKIVANADNLIGGSKRRDISYLVDRLKSQNNSDAAKRVVYLNDELSLLANLNLNLVSLK